MKYTMIKPGKANINGRYFDWKEGQVVDLSTYEKSVLTRGGYVGEAAKQPAKRPKAAEKRKLVLEKK